MIKICGLSTPDGLEAALAAGADAVGFVHVAGSPRHLDLPRAAALSRRAAGRAVRVLLLVDADDAMLDAALDAVGPDLVQLHGRETPARVAAVRARAGRPVVKAVGIGDAHDLAAAAAYVGVADRLLLDAKPPSGAVLTGGNGAPFDWSLLRALDLGPGVVLSGGLTPGNVGEAIAATGLRAVDVSSGVERRRGEKDPDLIADFVREARAALARHGERTRAA